VERPAHGRRAHDFSVPDQTQQLFAAEIPDARPESDKRRTRLLGLHTAEPIDDVKGG
jgi:hypothetical protein